MSAIMFLLIFNWSEPYTCNMLHVNSVTEEYNLAT
jgi:hypothetical protein